MRYNKNSNIVGRCIVKICSSVRQNVRIITGMILLVIIFATTRLDIEDEVLVLPTPAPAPLTLQQSHDLRVNIKSMVALHAAKLKKLRAYRSSLSSSSLYKHPPVKSAETDFKVDKIYDILTFPSPNDTEEFDDNMVKVQLTNKLKPKLWSNENKLKIFVVLHSHNDPGWKKTFEDYYKDQTKAILDNVLEHLTQDPTLKFIWAEMSFFSLWWRDLNATERNQVRKLVDNQQLEFVAGGWVMPDEANVHYISYLTQLIEGHQFLKEHLNYTAKNGWAIDPFGIAASINYLQGRAGIRNTVFTRVHYILKQWLRERQSMEFRWRQQWDPSGSTDVNCYLMPYYSYDTFQTCGPDTHACRLFQSKTTGPDDIHKISIEILTELRKKSLIFKTNNLLWPIGGDFHWGTEKEWKYYAPNLKSIVNYINQSEQLYTEIKFATLDDYFTAVQNDMNKSSLSTSTLSGDFFTYSGEAADYWSGYFTSRVFHKSSERQLMGSLRNAQMLFTLMSAEVSKHWGKLTFDFILALLKALVRSRRNLSLFQHHDGITGTSRDAVVVDYAKKLYDSMLSCQFVAQQSLFVLTNLKRFQGLEFHLENIKNDTRFYSPTSIKFGDYRNLWMTTVVEVNSQTPIKIVTVFNSLEFARTELFQIGVTSPNARVVSLDGKTEIPGEIFPSLGILRRKTLSNKTETHLRAHDDRFDLNFEVQLKPLEIRSFKIINFPPRKEEEQRQNPRIQIFNNKPNFSPNFLSMFGDGTIRQSTTESDESIQISNEYLKVQFNENGTTTKVWVNGSEHPFQLSFNYFKSDYGSGLYSFVPSKRAYRVHVKGEKPVIIVVKGQLKSYVEVVFPVVSHRLTVFHHEGMGKYALDVTNTIDVTERSDYELFMRLKTSINSGETFYTDSNGFQMLKRKRRSNLPTQGNFYPIAASAFIQDDNTRLTLVGAQPGGGTSLDSGSLEIMQDRIVNRDDGHDAGQGGTDNVPTIARYKILIENILKTSNETTTKEEETVPFLSLAASHQLHSLLHPVQGFIFNAADDSNTNLSALNDESRFKPEENVTTVAPPSLLSISNGLKAFSVHSSSDYIPSTAKTEFPCDILLDIASPLLRYKDSDNDSRIFFSAGEGVGFVFHRLGFDARFDPSPVLTHCSLGINDVGVLRFNKLFQDLFQDLELVSPSFVHAEGNKARLPIDSALELKSMEVRGIISRFKNLKPLLLPSEYSAVLDLMS